MNASVLEPRRTDRENVAGIVDVIIYLRLDSPVLVCSSMRE